jgi:hypothetical protein
MANVADGSMVLLDLIKLLGDVGIDLFESPGGNMTKANR